MNNYEEFLYESKKFYESIKCVFCPTLNQNIIFNSKGFHHLLFDGLGHPRSRNERVYRLGLLPLVIPVIKKAITVNEYTPPTFSNTLKKNVEYWLLKEIAGKKKNLITVVLRRIGNGNITFYSVWKKNRSAKKPD